MSVQKYDKSLYCELIVPFIQSDSNVIVGFKQESAPPAEEEALPGSTSRQDGQPDREPGAHGERPQGLTDARRAAAALKLN